MDGNLKKRSLSFIAFLKELSKTQNTLKKVGFKRELRLF
jgi:hypothetical protein